MKQYTENKEVGKFLNRSFKNFCHKNYYEIFMLNDYFCCISRCRKFT